ncbi:hypothetical protein TNCV_665281 [Trichonephila clavipes]|uniref:Uncharacterized protein n=1 Tax=Trichonephila clavipes TaxID=2585209 RepID=A0A8X6SFM5_TRICX|nr:hypothetical protein TNCV_665281 [Trichonephila clavipes]
MLWEAMAGRNYPPTNKNTLIRALTEEWDKLPQQLLDNVVQKWYDVWNVASHSTVDIFLLNYGCALYAGFYGISMFTKLSSATALEGEDLLHPSQFSLPLELRCMGIFIDQLKG